MNAAKFIVEGDEKFYGDFDGRHLMGTGVRNELTEKFYTGTPNNLTPIFLYLILKVIFFSVA